MQHYIGSRYNGTTVFWPKICTDLRRTMGQAYTTLLGHRNGLAVALPFRPSVHLSIHPFLHHTFVIFRQTSQGIDGYICYGTPQAWLTFGHALLILVNSRHFMASDLWDGFSEIAGNPLIRLNSNLIREITTFESPDHINFFINTPLNNSHPSLWFGYEVSKHLQTYCLYNWAQIWQLNSLWYT